MPRYEVRRVMHVSIHVPLAEHDLLTGYCLNSLLVSIHVPLAEHDPFSGLSRLDRVKFQFTCPSRSTTSLEGNQMNVNVFQFTCPSRSTTPFRINLRRDRKFQFTCPSRSTT